MRASVTVSFTIAASALIGGCANVDGTRQSSPEQQTIARSADDSFYRAVELPPGFSERPTDMGRVFTDSSARTLYVRVAATPCQSQHVAPAAPADNNAHFEYSSPTCAEQWPPVI